MDPKIQAFKQKLAATVIGLQTDLRGIRTGTANPALLENIIVDAYGGSTKMKILEMATVMTEGPGALVITPFDPATTSEIEKAILKSPLGLNPQVNGNSLLVRIPPLSEEQRGKMIKMIAQIVEEKKHHIREDRDEIRRKVKAQFEEKSITEDEKFKNEKEIDKITHEVSDEIQTHKENKEKELMEV